MEMIRLENYSFNYTDTTKAAIKCMSIVVDRAQFVLVCGPSGCGKTTLLRNLKKEIAPYGEASGDIYIDGVLLKNINAKESAAKIGFVRQNPENQIVTDTVWHELAFGLENLGLPTSVIRRRVAETAHFFGINTWFEQSVFELSGGQKQLLNLAAVMAMQPDVIILDEPTAQLDPISAKEFLTVLNRINRELGTTVILSEHRLEDVLDITDKVLLMQKGQKEFFGDTKELIEMIAQHKNHEFSFAMPSAVQISMALGEKKSIPVNVREGRDWLKQKIGDTVLERINQSAREDIKKQPLLEAKEIWFRYSDNFVLKNFSTKVFGGSMLCIVGGNASGKTTALSIMAGLLGPIRGKVKLYGKDLKNYKNNDPIKYKIAKMEQNPKTMFSFDSVISELKETGAGEQKIAEIVEQIGLEEILEKHPYDISGGEQQKVALAKLLLFEPQILLLDEPTKGIDVYAKDELALILKKRCKAGDAVVIVTHDVEFAAKHADECEMIFNGEVMSRGSSRDFFSGNMFYTTSANRISRGMIPGAITVKDVISTCRENKPSCE